MDFVDQFLGVFVVYFVEIVVKILIVWCYQFLVVVVVGAGGYLGMVCVVGGVVG